MIQVSIIVPVYNTPKSYLRECIDSLLAQTLDSCEIILVNDASTDDTLSYLGQYADRYPQKIRLIDSPENLRQGGARNLGIRVARGEYIAFMDSDDLALPHMYERLYAKAVAENADTVLCRWKRFSDNRQVSGESVIPSAWSSETAGQREAVFLDPQSVCCKLYRRSIVMDNRIYFPEKMFYEDNAWCPLCMLYMQRYAFVDEALYLYRFNETSTTECGSFEKYMDRCRSALWLEAELKRRELAENISQAADFWFFHCYWVSAAKMCVNGFDRIYYRELLQLRSVVWPKRKQYFSNPYYVNNLRGYEAEDKLYHKLLLYVPIVGVAVIKLAAFLRRVKHGRW